MKRTSRRRVLHALGVALPTVLAGCNATDDPSEQLLRDVEGVELVRFDGTYYHVSHTFTTYVLDVEEVAEPGDGAQVLEYESVRDDDSVRTVLEDPLPGGPEEPMRPTGHSSSHRTSRHSWTSTRTSRPTVGWGDGTLFTDDVPREVERSFEDAGYARLDETTHTLHGFAIRRAYWEGPPLDLSVSGVSDPPGVELTVENTTSGTVVLRNEGVAPFGVLYAVPDDGEPVQLWSPSYRDAPELSLTGDGVSVNGPTELRVHPNQTRSTTYHLARDGEAVDSGTYEVRGWLGGYWNRPSVDERPGNHSITYPYGVEIRV